MCVYRPTSGSDQEDVYMVASVISPYDVAPNNSLGITGWDLFWLFLVVLVIAAVIVGVLYHRSEPEPKKIRRKRVVTKK